MMNTAQISAQLGTVITLLSTLTIFLQVSYAAYRPLTELNTDGLDILLDAISSDQLPSYPSNQINEEPLNYESDILPTNKRYARLSYYYGSPGRSRSRSRSPYYHSRYYRSRYYKNYYSPWLNLPDTQCLRQDCSSDKDCCRRYSKCDKSAHVCYNCWYRHHCRTSRDCCERYPYCNKHKGGVCQ